MKFEYREHAEENIKERNLKKEVIENVIKNPDKVFDSRFGRKIAQKIVGSKILRVVYEKEGNTYIIITAYYTKSGRYK